MTQISKDSVFDELDHRSRWKQTQQTQIHNWIDGRMQLEVIFKRYGYDQPIQELALSFCIQDSLVDFVIPGMMNVEEVNGCLKSLKIKSFSKELLREIEVFNDKFNEIVVI